MVDGRIAAVADVVIAVSGLPGAGSTTMRASLAARFGVQTTGLEVEAAGSGIEKVARRPGDAPVPPDLELRVIGAQLRAADRAAIVASDVPVVVVAGKADTRPAAAEQARAAARELGRPVVAVSGLLAGATIGRADLDALRRWHRDGISVPVAAAAFAEEAGADRNEQRLRAQLLARLGRSGLTAAVATVGRHPAVDEAGLAAHLHAMSGIDALIAPIVAAAPVIAARRRVRRLAGLR
ncbi:hypothetical protein, partial [Gordonia sp. (in: high G+C Gram-positive bacteria)]|uniref:hypothetical protein n=1 Tax=Gordonia sp. (in: high G+C Gram-positive bacteria) TaxID=84139 RepID=UPI003C734814